MNSENEVVVEKLLKCISGLEYKHFLSYLRSKWNVKDKYSWMENYLEAIANLDEGKKSGGKRKDAGPPVQRNKLKDGKVALKLREFLAINALVENKGWLNYLFLLAMAGRTLQVNEDIDPVVSKEVMNSFIKVVTKRADTTQDALSMYLIHILMAKVKNDGGPSNTDSIPELHEEIGMLDRFYLLERLRNECALASREGIVPRLPPTFEKAVGGSEEATPSNKGRQKGIVRDQDRRRLALMEWAEASKPTDDKAIAGYLMILGAYCKGHAEAEDLQVLIDDLGDASIGKRDKTLLYGLLNNLILQKIKAGKDGFSQLFWLLLKTAVEHLLITTGTGTISVIIARNLLIQGVRTGNGAEAVKILKKKKPLLAISHDERDDFLKYADIFLDFNEKWRVKEKGWSNHLENLSKMRFEDGFQMIGLFDLRFQMSYQQGEKREVLRCVLMEMQEFLRQSEFFREGVNRAILEQKLGFYEKLVAPRERTTLDWFVSQIKESSLDASDKDWIVSMALRYRI